MKDEEEEDNIPETTTRNNELSDELPTKVLKT
jgi:hypothetical protein